MAIPLLLIGMIQVTVGSTVYARTDRQIQELHAVHQTNPIQFVASETARMTIVNRNFKIYKLV
jgi:hypothetical protein